MGDRVLAVVGSGIIDVTTPVLRADLLGVTRGDGVFETMRVRRQRPFLIEAHLQRMRAGAARVGLVLPDASQWQETLQPALAAYGDELGLLRLYTLRGTDFADTPFSYALISPIQDSTMVSGRDGTHAVTLTLGITSAARAAAPWLLGGVKTTSYAAAMAGKREAEGRGAADAIWISSDGQVLEEATSSVVWVSGGAAYTTPADTGILAGTSVACLRDLTPATGVSIHDRRASLDELRGADEILLVSSVRGVAAVLTLDGAPVGTGRPGPVGGTLHTAFEEAFAAATD